jgi:hypothetical protein
VFTENVTVLPRTASNHQPHASTPAASCAGVFFAATCAATTARVAT